MKSRAQPCTSIAEYYLAGLSDATSTISSTIDSANQPNLVFPSTYFSSTSYSPNDPVRTNSGVWITPQKYIMISNKWIQSLEESTEVNMWIFHISGTIDVFASVGLQNNVSPSRLITMQGVQSGMKQLLYGFLGTFNTSISEIKHGWNLVTFADRNIFFNFSICRYNLCNSYHSGDLTGYGLLTVSDSFYFGCKTCTSSDISYIIFSVRVMRVTGWCTNNSLNYALTNGFYPCGDNTRTGSETCDDGNLDDCDGCSSHCAVETGYTCSDPGVGQADVCSCTGSCSNCNQIICGNGKRESNELCDDGNTSDGDGCSSLCKVEINWECSGGNSTSKDQCSEVVNQAMSKTGQAAAAAAGGAAALFSFCNLSTPTGLWITMNQFQLILLLLLTKSSIPKSIVDYLSGLKATTCSFNFIPFKDIPCFYRLIEYLNSALPRKELDYFGIFSGSTLSNNFSLICILIIIAFIHLLFMIIYKLIKHKIEKHEKCNKCTEKVYQFFAFSLYVRIFLETYIFLLLSSFSELYHWNTSNTSNIISLFIASICAWICVIFVALSLISWHTNKYRENLDIYIPLKELYSGIRNAKASMLYSTFLLTRRLIFVILLVYGETFSNIILIYPMIILQIAYLVQLLIVRPFKEVKNNIIEITNECFYLLLILLLSYYNTKERWKSVMENAYLCIILGNSIVIIIIMIISLSTTSVIKLRRKCSKNKVHQEELKENEKTNDEPSQISNINILNVIQTSKRCEDSAINTELQEENKHEIKFESPNHPRVPSINELYWQNYSHFNGSKIKRS